MGSQKKSEPEFDQDESKIAASGGNEPDANVGRGADDLDEAQAAAILDAGQAARKQQVAQATATTNEKPSAITEEAPTSPEPAAMSDEIPGAQQSEASIDQEAQEIQEAPNGVVDDAADTPESSDTPISDSPSGDTAASAKPKKSNKNIIIGVIIALLIVLLGSAAAAYYFVVNKPQNVLNMAMVNTFSADKVNSASFNGTLTSSSEDEGTTAVTFRGAMNDQGGFDLSGELDALLTTVTLDARSTDGKTLYLRIGGLDGLMQLLSLDTETDMSYLSPFVDSVNDQWIQINESAMQQITGDDTSVTSKLSKADRDKLKEAYLQNQFMVVKNTYKDETISGKNCRHYQIVLDKTNLKSFVAAVKSAKISGLEISDTAQKSFNKQVDAANFDKYPVNLWISRSDNLIYQISLSSTDGSTGEKTEMRMTMENYNKEVKVTAPTDSKSIIEVLGEVMSGMSLEEYESQTLQDLGAGISL